MAKTPLSFWENYYFPLSGDVNQPWSWLYQFFPITINEMKTDDPALEKKIVYEAASYGKQLGKMMEAVEVLAKHCEMGELNSDEAKVLENFGKMADKIAAIKGGYQAPDSESVDTMIATLSYWKAEYNDFYENARQQLLKALEGDKAQRTKTRETRMR